MILGIGIDILEKKRISQIKLSFIKKLEDRILNNSEKKTYKKSKKNITNISKIFSIKEALIKSIGTGFRKNLSFKKIKIKNNTLGKPSVKQKKIKVYISISHDKNIIISIAIIRINKL